VNCHEAQEMIHAYVDDQLDLVKTLDMEKHLRDCSQCAAVHRNIVALRSSIRDGSLYFRAPPSLERRIRSSVLKNSPAKRTPWSRTWLAAAAALAIATSAWLAMRERGDSAQGLLASEVTSAHIRSLMAEHLWDVKSTDQHTVKPWFDGKLDFAPDVRDFKNDAFALEGGRLDYVAGRPVAALIYRHEKHFINLFIWPANGQSDQSEVATSHQGYALLHWVRSGMNYWAVSDTSGQTLRSFAKMMRDGGQAMTKPVE